VFKELKYDLLDPYSGYVDAIKDAK